MSSAVDPTTDIRTFRIDIADEQIDDLRRRIAATRWPSKELVDDRSQGVQLATMKELARYWTTEYDWRKCEARLNALPQFTTEIDGVDIHFIHVKSPHEDALPLIMTHGWPGSVVELLETNRILLSALDDDSEGQTIVYLARALTIALIALAIADKNWPQLTGWMRRPARRRAASRRAR